MAKLDLTLDKMRFPGIENFNPEFGTKETTGRGVHSVNLSENDMMPFLLQRPVSVVENSSTGAIEADRKLAVEASGVTLTLGRPSYPGCKVTVYGSFSSGTATVAYDKDANNTASVVVGAGERVELEANALRYFEVKAPAMSELAVASGTLSQAKTIPLGYASDAKLAFKAVFPVGHNDATSADSLTLNGIAVVSNQNGTLAPIPHHAMAEDGSTVYKVLDPNTTLEMYYTADYDGNGTPAFVIVGNPLVLSSNDYTIYANGWKTDAPIDSVADGELRPVTSNAVRNATKISLYSTSGILLNSIRGEIEGSGYCFGVFSNGIAKIDFTITISANSMISDSNFNYGLNSDYLFQKGWPRVTPISGGRICIISPQKTLSDYNGFGAFAMRNSQFWHFARVYTAGGDIGQWPSNVLAQGTTITGVVYGTY